MVCHHEFTIRKIRRVETCINQIRILALQGQSLKGHFEDSPLALGLSNSTQNALFRFYAMQRSGAMTSKAKGLTISVTAETDAGCRRHMEDYLAVKLCPNEELSKLPHLKEQAYIGVFDGHGGKEAAKCARERLWDVIQSQPKYKLSDINSVKESLEEAFVALHKEMEPLRGEESSKVHKITKTWYL